MFNYTRKDMLLDQEHRREQERAAEQERLAQLAQSHRTNRLARWQWAVGLAVAFIRGLMPRRRAAFADRRVEWRRRRAH